MNKKLIASLLSISMAAGVGVQTPVQLMASTVSTTHTDVVTSGDQQSVESEGIIESVFTPIKSDHYADYANVFKVTGIKSYENNGGQYQQSSALQYAFDGDTKTYWETGKRNESEYKNEVTITFENIETINRIAYAPRPGNKGHVQKMSIYASLTEDGEDFELVASGAASVRSEMSEFRFEPTQFKRLKFVFEEANQDWAAAGELMFFKEDIVADKMASLFTDSTKSQVSEAFASMEQLNALEIEAKEHPFYESFKQDIQDAKVLLEDKDITYIDAEVTKFDLTGDTLQAYDEVYKVKENEIKSITNNGKHYGDKVIQNAIDGNINTNWHSGIQNTADFTNEVVIELKELTTLDRVVFAASRGTKRGFPEKFEIYASRTSQGDTFEKVSSGVAQATQDTLQIKFNPTEFKRLKFVFTQGYENWACIGEMSLYKEDKVDKVMDNIFTNGLMMEVNPEYNSIEAITQLEQQVSNHPLKHFYEEDIQLAKEIVQNKDLFKDTRVVTGEQRGNYKEESEKRKFSGYAYTSFESIGKYVTPGEEIVVYVDADPNGVLPSLCFGQVGRGQGDWRRWVDLKPGKNVITAPTNINPSALYLVNNAKPSDQAYAPRVRVEGGTKFPVYIHGETDPQAFFEEVKDYAENVEYSDEAFVNGNPEGKVFNIAEFVSENVVITTSAKGAVAGLTEAHSQGYDIADTMEEWEQLYAMFQTYMGFEENATEEKHSYFPNKFVSRVFQGVPTGFADHGYTGYLGSDNAERDGIFFKTIAMPPSMPGGDNWAYAHEFGHIFNTKHIIHGEVSNNLYAQEYRRVLGVEGDRVNWDGLMKRFQGETVKLGHWENLGILSQLDIAYGYDTYAKVSRVVRDQEALIASIEGNDLRRKAVAYSLAVGENLLDFFEGWNYTDVTPQMEEVVKHLPKPTRKIEYLHGEAYDYEGNGFSEDVTVTATSKLDKEAKTHTLTFAIDEQNQEDVLGYEILKDGEVIGYTKDSSFTVKNVDPNTNTIYQVVAYAKDLTTAKPVEVNTYTPAMKLQQEKVTLALGETFNAREYVKGMRFNGEDITSQVEIIHNVNPNARGLYEVKYTLVDQGIAVERMMQVEVVSEYDYLSDHEWQAVEYEWGTPRRNHNIQGRVNGEAKVFDKGFAIHANGKIVYDLSDKDYDRFEVLVGVDMGIAPQDKSSIQFEIIGDGEVLATSKVMKHADDMAYINVPIKGVSELVIQVKDAGDSISNDHGIIANPKLTNNNAIPTLTVEDKEVQLGEAIDFMEGVSAYDAEDGDLTEKVEIISNTYEAGKTGRFEVVYSVTDVDHNKVEYKSYVTVYKAFDVKKSMYDTFNNLSEYNKQFKLPIHTISNNGGNYPGNVISRAIDSNINTFWETNTQNSDTFKNEVIFDLGENVDIDKMTYASRRGGKGFANKFSVYVSHEAEGNDFILVGKGEYLGNKNDVVQFDLKQSNVRRVKFVFDEANENWASIAEVAFYKADAIADKVTNDLFGDSEKTQVNVAYNTLEKLEALRSEIENHPAKALFEEDIKRAEELIRNTFPTLTVEEMTYVKLNDTFDLMSGVIADDQEDGDIRHRVEIKENGFTTEKTGKYNIVYTVTDRDGNSATKERTVVVYSETEYLSDTNWESARTDHGDVNKDKASSGGTIKVGIEGETLAFDKGIGTHANSEIVYDLSHLSGPVFFETYVGVDRNIQEQNNSSIIFKILGDGQELYNSGLMKRSDDAKHVKLDLTGISKLELIVEDGGNYNSFDHANFADAKFLILDAKPSLVIPKDEAVKVGEYINDIYGTYSASDAEDGNLTSAVEVTGEVNFKQPGDYTITYKVQDSDGNEVVKTRNIAVVDMQDFTYLSDYDWESATCGWGNIKKDLSPSDNIIRLTDATGQEVQFEKGLGTHARSVIKYDLTDKEAQYFSAYVGVDRAMYHSVASVAFEVWLDGEKVAETDVMYAQDPMEYIEVNVAGAKELMLVATDGGNGNGSDHAVWGDAKLHYANENNIKVDTEALETLIEEVNSLSAENYTQASWNVLVEIRDEALALLEGEMTQGQVDDMVNKLLEAKNALVTVGNKQALESLVASVDDLETHIYTQASWEALVAQVEDAKQVLDMEDATEQVVNGAVEKLQTDIDTLEISKGKAGLYELLQVANAMEQSDYSQEVDWETFAAVTEEYNKIYWAPTVHAEPVFEVVLEYYSNLIQSIESHRLPENNKGELEQVIASVEDLEAHVYTQASWEDLQKDLEEAKRVVDEEDATQQVIDEMTQKLESAIDHLEISQGKARLYELLQVANAMEQSDYSQEADWETFAAVTEEYNKIYWAPTVHAEPVFEVVLEYYSGLIQSIESHRIIETEEVELEVEQPEEKQPELEQPQEEQLQVEDELVEELEK